MALLDAATGAGVDAERALRAVEAGLKKHPLAQEPSGDWLLWTRHIIAGVMGLMEPGRFGALSGRAVLDLYHQSPRLVDAQAAAAIDAFVAFLIASIDAGEGVVRLQARLRDLRRRYHRVTHAALQAAAAAPSGTGTAAGSAGSAVP